ncbi:MAG: hypothetical protein R3338_05030 [Thermoanaerobaculia bacterium]|nr:hypothetical protein [Thermoanaerobaculia bacterium]
MTVYDPEMMTRVRQAIARVDAEEYLNALVEFAAIREDTKGKPFPTEGLSYYGLCVALVEKEYETAIEMARKAIELQFYRADHYLNLSKIHAARGDRKRAVEIADEGLGVVPGDPKLKEFREELGVRQPKAIRFLDRSNPVNKSIGRARRSKDEEGREARDG